MNYPRIVFTITASILAMQYAVSALAAELWVDAGAQAIGDGSADRPFPTIQQAALKAVPGDTVHVRPGVYRERVMPVRGGEPGKPIRYISEQRHGAVVKGSDPWTQPWKEEGGGLFSGGLDETLFTDKDYVDGGNPFVIPYEWDKVRNKLPPYPFKSVQWTLGQLFMDGAPVRECSSRAELLEKSPSWWYDAASKRILLHLDQASPAVKRIEITTRRGVFRPKIKGLGYIEISGFVFEHCANQFPAQFWKLPENAESGMVGTRGGHHWVIEGNVFRHAKSIGLSFGSSGLAGLYDNELPTQADPSSAQIGFHQIRGNSFIANGALGAMGCNHTDVVFENNVFIANNSLLNTAYETGGIKTHGAYGLRIENNAFIDNECMGVWLDNTWKSCRISRNTFAGNRGRALFLEMDDNSARTACIVDCNLFLDGRPDLLSGLSTLTPENQVWRPWIAGIYGHDADGVRIFHNLFSGQGYGIFFRKIADRKGGAADIAVVSNLFVGTALTPVCIPTDNPPMVRGNYFETNVYPAASDKTRFAVTAWSKGPKEGLLDKPGLQRLEALATASAERPVIRYGDTTKPPAGYQFGFAAWRSLSGCDKLSIQEPLRCTLDRSTWTLTLVVPATSQLPLAPVAAELQRDFVGKPFSKTAAPGPFAPLKSATYIIKLPIPDYSWPR